MKRIAVLFLFVVFLQGCLSKHVFTLTDQEVAAHYARKTTKPEFGFFNSEGRMIYYAIQGDTTKPLLVLVHGAPGRWYSSINLLDDSLLLQHYRILAYDRPGYGQSGLGDAVTSIEKQAEYLSALIDHHNTTGQAVTVVGRSYGTPIAACYAMHHPQQVKKLVLLGACIDPGKEKYFWFSFAGKLAWVQQFTPLSYTVATSEKFAHRKELKKLLPGWAQISSPVFLVHGKKDWMADTANVHFALNHITGAPVSVYLLTESGHNVTFSNPELIINLVTNEGEINYSEMPDKIHPAKKR
jgi:pimeloyl-ACP methyl ester carboxylesterase